MLLVFLEMERCKSSHKVGTVPQRHVVVAVVRQLQLHKVFSLGSWKVPRMVGKMSCATDFQ